MGTCSRTWYKNLFRDLVQGLDISTWAIGVKSRAEVEESRGEKAE